MIFTFLQFYDQIIEIWNDEEFMLLKDGFKSIMFGNTNLKAFAFNVDVPVKIISNLKIEKIFKKKRYKGFEKAWSRFYREYPTSTGYFEFSNIAYSENYAMVYVVWRAKPLIGNGGIEILIKSNDQWKKLAYLNMWNN